jgi:hypothetical protein
MEDIVNVKSDVIVPFESLNKKLLNVQSKLVATKGSKNNFGKYNYRNVEDILSEVKPLLVQNGLTMTMSDTLSEVCGEVYVEARIVLEDADNRDVSPHDGYPNNIVSTAFAREPRDQKGMSPCQMTGTASSYARKYALGALFLISGEACPDFASEVSSILDQHIKESPDSIDTLQGKGKGKDKDKVKVKEIIIPKLGVVGKDVKKNDGEDTCVPLKDNPIPLKDLDDVKINYLFLRSGKFFINHPVFLEALLEVKEARELAEEVPM